MKFWPFGNKSKAKARTLRRGYDAASSSRLFASFGGSLSSADAETKASMPQLRARSRELARNNDFVKNALRIIRNNVVGQGIPMQSQVRKVRGNKLDEATNTAIENLWWEWTKAPNCHTAGKYSFQDIEGVIMSSLPKNGEVFIRLHRQRFGTSLVPLSLELLNADMLDETYNTRLEGNREIRMGVERNEFGRPVAYHFHAKHPNDAAVLTTYRTGARVRVPAADIIHLFVPEDEEQTRAVPWFASAMTRLHHLQGYEQATVVGARARASIMGFIESPEGQLQGDDVEGEQRVSDFEPGTFKQLNPGEKVNVPQLGSGTGELDPFMKSMLRGVAAGVGISYESLSKDYAGATYSSARQALLEDRDLWKTLQQWLIRNFHQRIFEEWLLLAYLSELVSLPLYATRPELYTAVRWMPRGFPWIDPVKEAEASKALVRSGFATMTEIIAEKGGDFEELMMQRKRELEITKALGLVLDTDPAELEPNGKPPATAATISPADEKVSEA